MLIGWTLSIGCFVVVVVVAQVSTLFIFSVLLYVWGFGLGFKFRVYLDPKQGRRQRGASGARAPIWNLCPPISC